MHSFHQKKRLIALSCVLGLLVCPLVQAKKQVEAAARNFLPPVALINNTLTIEDLEGKPLSEADESLNPVVFSAVSPATVKLSDKPAALSNNLHVNQTNEHETLLSLQQKVDERDLRSLWDATVEKNPVIRFSLEKLALPMDLQAKHSSRFLNKTLAAMLNGAAMGAMYLAPGAGAMQNMGVATISQAAQNVIMGNNKPQQQTSGLTATEQIQLAGLVDDLKADLVQNYQSYKKTLEQLAQARAVSLKNNNLYATALKSPNPLARMAAASAYYKAMMNETEVKQRALVYRLKLERMAGKEAVNNLQLALVVTPLSTEVATTAPVSTASVSASVASKPNTSSSFKALETPLQAIDILPTAPLEAIHPITKEDNATIGPSLSILPSSQETAGPEVPLGSPINASAYIPPSPLSPIAEPSFDAPPVPSSPNHLPFFRKGDY